MSVKSGYQAIREGAGFIDLSPAGKIQVHGANAVQFLNGLVSNDLKSLGPGDGVLVAFPSLQGKLLALARVYRHGDALLLEVDEINREKILRNLSRFVPAGEFFVTDLSDQLGLLGIEGPRATEIVTALGGEAVEGESRQFRTRQMEESEIWIASHRRCGESGYDIFFPRELRESLTRRLVQLGAVACDATEFETARIEAGVAREGVDTGEEYIILETGLAEAISYTKGCYLGQEVIARIHWRGQPARQLRGLELDELVAPDPLIELRAVDGSQAGRRIGNITSAVFSPALGRPIALGYVHRYYLTPGTNVEIWRDEQRVGQASVAELPFVPARS